MKYKMNIKTQSQEYLTEFSYKMQLTRFHIHFRMKMYIDWDVRSITSDTKMNSETRRGKAA